MLLSGLIHEIKLMQIHDLKRDHPKGSQTVRVSHWERLQKGTRWEDGLRGH